jgi:hypothetical protein
MDLEKSGAFNFATLQLEFENLLHTLDMTFDPYGSGLDPDHYWTEVFSRLISANYDLTLNNVPSEAQHVAG